MTELRWLERKIPFFAGSANTRTERVLQFRLRVWIWASAWRDVPLESLMSRETD